MLSSRGMSKKKSKKVAARKLLPVALPGSTSWGSLWRGVSKSLSSKKFLAAAGAVLIAVSQGDWNAVFVVTMMYLGAQGVVDTAKAIRR